MAQTFAEKIALAENFLLINGTSYKDGTVKEATYNSNII